MHLCIPLRKTQSCFNQAWTQKPIFQTKVAVPERNPALLASSITKMHRRLFLRSVPLRINWAEVPSFDAPELRELSWTTTERRPVLGRRKSPPRRAQQGAPATL
ncbi:hypothetical protein AK812_SmicGene3757 [Symbiodinium microadriaticum]|uniref:Uncharacterized protein n=1 Tax=Symbiodinium microadriaticum TaxID=2951 RepID=A0A1Q9EY35_SYMMI|nr:hypothetical protein AK812_SmicGene3757 [Symbiodinium microadriaticum]